jgi:aminopeptidase
LTDSRIQKFANILVDYSTAVKPGDRVAITATTYAEPVLSALYARILERGGHPHLLIDLPEQEELFFAHAQSEHYDFIPVFHRTAFEEFDVLIKLRSETNTRALTSIPAERLAQRNKSQAALIQAQMRRGADGSLRWMSTLFPTPAYAMEAGMGVHEYQDFFYRACHADDDTADPVARWQSIEATQQAVVDRLNGRDVVEVRGPNADLKLSIKGRTFINACGKSNLPDGEVFTGPVEESVNGWVHYTYPAVFRGRVVEGIRLVFKDGKVVEASADTNQDLLLSMLDSDPGARYLGEFAIGTNFQIDRFTRSILLDEKIGGSFHTAIGAGYPETGSLNRSVVHWDMICDLRQDSEIRVDGEVIYRSGQFVF